MFRPMPLLLAALAVCAGALTYDWYESRPRFAIDEPDRVYADLPVGELQKFTFRIHNLTGEPLRVVGAEFSCGKTCCFGARVNQPVVIGPHSDREIPADVTPTRPGDFSSELNIFLDVGYLVSQPVSVRGTAK